MKARSRIAIAMALGLMFSGLTLAAQQTTPPAASSEDATAIPSSQSTPPVVADSQARIVRLSDVHGEVQVDRNTGQGFEQALLNLPMVQGTRLRTGAGFAEVEFEDNRTLRLAPDTQVEFSQLELRPSGTTVSTMTVERGMVYVGLTRSTGDEFTLAFARNKIPLPPSSHVRLDMGDKWANLAVFKGNVHVEALNGPITVGKDRTVTFNLVSPTEPQLVKNVIPWTYDFWDQAATDYHNRKVNSSSYGNSPYAYGLPDMRYYGTFVNTPDCGRIWRPFFASAAWDPYSNGTWVWYPGSGWTWVSPYPWGWTPYHYGTWGYCPNYGWGWRPRGSWQGLISVPKPPQHPRPHYPPHSIPRAPQPPAPGAPAVVAVSRKPPVTSGLTSADRFVARQDSAGMGVPRTLGNLAAISGQVERHSSAIVAVNAAPMLAGKGTESGSGYNVSAVRASAGRSGTASYSGGRSSASTYSGSSGRSSSTSDAGRGVGASAWSGGSASMGGGSAGGGGRR
ncbi:MAG: DUF6600 domain-containing protein [Candidatus Korobacteraceae bacterium]